MDRSAFVAPGAFWQADFAQASLSMRVLRDFARIQTNRSNAAIISAAMQHHDDITTSEPTVGATPPHVCMRIEFPTASRARVRGLRHARAAVENSLSAVQHLTKALFLSKRAEPLLLSRAMEYIMA